MRLRFIFFFLVLVGFGWLNAGSSQGAIVLDKVVAIVNQEVITWSELYKAMEFDAAPELKKKSIEERRAIFKQHEIAFLETLIEMRLVLQEAKKTGVTVGETEISRAMAEIKAKHKLDDKAFAEAIAREGFTLEDYKRRLGEQIIISRLVDQEIRSKIVVTEADLNRFLAENKDLAAKSEGYDISLIFIRKGQDVGQVEARAKEAFEKIKAGTPFGEAARTYSDDPSAKRGGDLGFVARGDLSNAFVDKLGALKPGGITEPFWTDAGMYLLRLNGSVAFKNPEEFRAAMRNKLAGERFEREYKSWIKGLRQRAYVEIK